ncbi:MAG: cytochrome b/b6 domain-containing protein [Pseudomonadales bacterium]
MNQNKRKFHYSVAKVLHWIAVFLIGFNLLSAWKLGSFSQDIKEVLVMIHSGVGVTVFFLMLFRWWWRRSRNLYTPPGWYKRPSMLLQWIFYPLVLVQVLVGVLQAVYIDYPVLAFGFIDFSTLASADSVKRELLLNIHIAIAVVLIVMIIAHGMERYKKIFT